MRDDDAPITGDQRPSTLQPGGSTTSLDTAAPSWVIRAGKAPRVLKTGRLRFSVTPAEACTLVASAKVGKAKLARAKKALAATRTLIKLRIGSKGRRAPKKALRRKRTVRVSLALRCVDAAGNANAQRATLKVRR